MLADACWQISACCWFVARVTNRHRPGSRMLGSDIVVHRCFVGPLVAWRQVVSCNKCTEAAFHACQKMLCVALLFLLDSLAGFSPAGSGLASLVCPSQALAVKLREAVEELPFDTNVLCRLWPAPAATMWGVMHLLQRAVGSDLLHDCDRRASLYPVQLSDI